MTNAKLSLFVSLMIFIYFCTILFLVTKADRISNYDYEYDYDRENPNAIISGQVVGGTVYASYPKNSPGLGWIL